MNFHVWIVHCLSTIVCLLWFVIVISLCTLTHKHTHTHSIYVVMLCAFLLGLGDACFNTQV